MPYYLFKILPDRRMEKLAEHTAFREASSQAKALRREIPQGEDYRVKVIFAPTEDEARFVLSQPRTLEPITGDEW
ncbi:MAG TPA: hypothetical protein DHV08_07265 [Rhodocyclaceae bacterium]|nr:MAG: hypothetical protein AUK49_11925 [Betaproteobacteria bacterium CG2_30_68_42]PIV71596.1 MAG: hypothetical protein COW56_13995 [Rhodocyclales bacterium CG17_big_fil_post_rev_8_21_14_2_50_68_7]PIX76118.1 MAG: hypothetical protein COZ38_02000 [Rhodocyclales bacterium CG_4_10_14_3_um_filter_68_10]PJA58105.1 MAG: hypothetical protein CO164_04200 [Rhodocyclales bacterium CG_4_9_14_3_um_filter_68_10]HCX33363.1 hypothetical protein [Rhodocyclaceae bacterium]